MTTNDKAKIGEIYENLDFKSSYEQGFDPHLEQLKTKANNNCHNIEQLLSGTITYYKREKKRFFDNPNDMNSFEALEKLESFLRPHLAQFREFRD